MADTKTPSTATVQICPKQTASINGHLANIENTLNSVYTLYNQEKNLVYTDFDTLTISSTASGLTTQKIRNNDQAFITVETGQIRFRMDGQAPTTTNGHILNPGDSITLNNKEQLTQFQAITTGSNATIQVSYASAKTQSYAVMGMKINAV